MRSALDQNTLNDLRLRAQHAVAFGSHIVSVPSEVLLALLDEHEDSTEADFSDEVAALEEENADLKEQVADLEAEVRTLTEEITGEAA